MKMTWESQRAVSQDVTLLRSAACWPAGDSREGGSLHRTIKWKVRGASGGVMVKHWTPTGKTVV